MTTRNYGHVKFGRDIPATGVRPEWLDGDTRITFNYGEGAPFHGESGTTAWFPHEPNWPDVVVFRLPADHWAYPVLDAGYEPWSGGRRAPRDWDGRKDVYYRDGKTIGRAPNSWKCEGHSADIIGYHKKAPPAPVASVPEPGTVTLRLRTAAEVESDFTAIWSASGDTSAEDCVVLLRRYGLIAPETALDRFAAARPDLVTADNREAIAAALEWREAA